MSYFAQEVIEPVAEKAVAMLGVLPYGDQIQVWLNQSEWELALESALFRAGKSGIEPPAELVAAVRKLNPNLMGCYERGVKAA